MPDLAPSIWRWRPTRVDALAEGVGSSTRRTPATTTPGCGRIGPRQVPIEELKSRRILVDRDGTATSAVFTIAAGRPADGLLRDHQAARVARLRQRELQGALPGRSRREQNKRSNLWARRLPDAGVTDWAPLRARQRRTPEVEPRVPGQPSASVNASSKCQVPRRAGRRRSSAAGGSADASDVPHQVQRHEVHARGGPC